MNKIPEKEKIIHPSWKKYRDIFGVADGSRFIEKFLRSFTKTIGQPAWIPIAEQLQTLLTYYITTSFPHYCFRELIENAFVQTDF